MLQRDAIQVRRRRWRLLMAAGCALTTTALVALVWVAPARVTAAPLGAHFAVAPLDSPSLAPSLLATPTPLERLPSGPGIPDPWAEPGTTTLTAPLGPDGGDVFGMTADGRDVLFAYEDQALDPHYPTFRGLGLYLYDTHTRTTELASVDSDGHPMVVIPQSGPAMSDDGSRILFEGDTRPSQHLPPQVWVHDRRLHKTWIVSVASNGTPGQYETGGWSISGDGKWAGLLSGAKLTGDGSPVPSTPNNQYLQAIIESVDHPGTAYLVSPNGPGSWRRFGPIATNYDGRYTVYSGLSDGDPSAPNGVWRWDRLTGHTELVSSSASIALYGRVVDDSGNYIAYTTAGQIYRHDMLTGRDDLVSVDEFGRPGVWVSYEPSISANGKFVSFWTSSPLVSDDTNMSPYGSGYPVGLGNGGGSGADIYVWNADTHGLARESVATDGTQANNNCSYYTAVSDDGTETAFTAAATDFAPDTPLGGIFLRTRSLAAADAGRSGPIPLSPFPPRPPRHDTRW